MAANKFVIYGPEGLPRAKRFQPQEWAAHQHTIEDLYVHQDKSLEDVMATMASEHSFSANRRQYAEKFRQWKIQKNIPGKVMRCAIHKAHDKPLRNSFSWKKQPIEEQHRTRYQQRHPNFDPGASPAPSTPSQLDWMSEHESVASPINNIPSDDIQEVTSSDIPIDMMDLSIESGSSLMRDVKSAQHVMVGQDAKGLVTLDWISSVVDTHTIQRPLGDSPIVISTTRQPLAQPLPASSSSLMQMPQNNLAGNTSSSQVILIESKKFATGVNEDLIGPTFDTAAPPRRPSSLALSHSLNDRSVTGAGQGGTGTMKLDFESEAAFRLFTVGVVDEPPVAQEKVTPTSHSEETTSKATERLVRSRYPPASPNLDPLNGTRTIATHLQLIRPEPIRDFGFDEATLEEEAPRATFPMLPAFDLARLEIRRIAVTAAMQNNVYPKPEPKPCSEPTPGGTGSPKRYKEYFWFCCNCQSGPLVLAIDSACPGIHCTHKRCKQCTCKTW